MFSSSSSSCHEMSLWHFFNNNMLTIHCTPCLRPLCPGVVVQRVQAGQAVLCPS